MGPKDRAGAAQGGAVMELSERLGRARERLAEAREGHAHLSRLLEGADATVAACAEERSRAREAEAALLAERDEIDAELAPLVEELQHAADSAGLSSRLEELQRRRVQCDKDLARHRETISRCTRRISNAESVRDHPYVVENERERVEELEAEVARLSEELAAAQATARRERARRVAPLVALAACALLVAAAAAGHALWVGGRVVIDDAAFPDPAIRFVATEADRDGDGMLSRAEIEACTSVTAPMTVSDLTGLSEFTALERLSLPSCDAGEIDLTGFPRLRTVEVGLESRASLDVSGLEGLERLTLRCCRTFSSVDLRGCSGLEELLIFAPVDEFVVDSGTDGALVRELRQVCEQNGMVLTEPGEKDAALWESRGGAVDAGRETP